MRGLALGASVALVLLHRDERGTWFWVGVALVVLNLVGLLAAWSRAGRPAVASASERRRQQATDRSTHRLDELLGVPAVAQALAAGPREWRQVSHLDEQELGPMSAEELARHVWLEVDESSVIALGEEVKPYVDLDVDEEDDPVISVLRSHPAVEDAFHEDREVYRVDQRRPIGVEEFATLAAQALVRHHEQAAARP